MKKAVKKVEFVRMIWDGPCVQLDNDYVKVQFDCGHTVMRESSVIEKSFLKSLVDEASISVIRERKDGKHGKN